ncbi:MAG: hypothetical protein IJX27_03940 [Clostridia bacterium]|nr:hypothetical protein [Clostridia bacterium]
MQKYIINNIKLPYRTSKDAALTIAEKALLKFFSKKSIVSLAISKRSLDARKRESINFVYSVTAEVEASREIPEQKLLAAGIARVREEALEPAFGAEEMRARPVIVGFGPCGMFCALMLAEYGYRPIVLERGGDIAEREAAVEKFLAEQVLDESSNIQFGAGGAGTFSDGKLVTRINDKKCAYVLRTLVELGAPENVLYEAKPHIGTDILKKVVSNMRARLLELGAEIHFGTKFTGFSSSAGKVTKVTTDKGELECSLLVLAPGHSARDTFEMLMEKGLSFVPKAFSVGVRIEHLQEEIDKGLYGDSAGDPLLPKGEYNLSHREGERGAYTFCMCPGGTVMAAASEVGGVVTNGMSRYARDGKNANAAVAVSILPEDFGASAKGAIEFQRALERKAFLLGGKSYFAPAQTVGDFLSGTRGTLPTKVEPTYMNGKVTMADMHELLPAQASKLLENGLRDFGHKLPGYDAPYAVLTGVESRTSSPVRIMRGEGFTALGYDNIYPCGEGAGYAGGITSAAVDGINCAMHIMARYKAKI